MAGGNIEVKGPKGTLSRKIPPKVEVKNENGEITVSRDNDHRETRAMHGLARALMADVEARAHAAGRRLLTLDTRTGDAAEPLYAGLGYVRVGVVPGYCIAPEGGRLDSTTIMYKQL